MSQCAWIAVVRDNETNLERVISFRYDSFASEEQGKKALQASSNGLFEVIEVSTNPYKYRRQDNENKSSKKTYHHN